MWGRKRAVDLLDTPEMDAFFARLDRLDMAQVMAMTAAWKALSPEVHERAWESVRTICARESLTKEIDRVRQKALDRPSGGQTTVPYQTNPWQLIKLEAAEAIVDAALAVSLGSRLDAATREVLMGPWMRATEAVR
jgi:hypothetical protein